MIPPLQIQRFCVGSYSDFSLVDVNWSSLEEKSKKGAVAGFFRMMGCVGPACAIRGAAHQLMATE